MVFQVSLFFFTNIFHFQEMGNLLGVIGEDLRHGLEAFVYGILPSSLNIY